MDCDKGSPPSDFAGDSLAYAAFKLGLAVSNLPPMGTGRIAPLGRSHYEFESDGDRVAPFLREKTAVSVRACQETYPPVSTAA